MPVFLQNDTEIPEDKLDGIDRKRPAAKDQQIKRAFLLNSKQRERASHASPR